MGNIGYAIVIGCLRGIARLPLSVLYGASNLLYLIVYRLIGYRKKLVRRNLANAFPDKTKEETRAIERRFYHHLCDCMVETIKMLHISDEEMRRRVDVRNAHLIEQAADDRRPVFLFIGHTGNWEWVQEVTKRISRPTVHGEIYRPLANKTFDKVMRDIRSRYPTQLIAQKQAVRTIIGMKRQHPSYLIGFIADQRPTRNSLNHWMTFLNQDTPYLVGAEEIGRHVNAKFLYLHIAKPTRGHYTMTVCDMPLADNRQEHGKKEYPYAELYMHMLEKNIKESPELWLWSHKRWKHKHVVDESTEKVN